MPSDVFRFSKIFQLHTLHYLFNFFFNFQIILIKFKLLFLIMHFNFFFFNAFHIQQGLILVF